jgi:hypothetical protein
MNDPAVRKGLGPRLRGEDGIWRRWCAFLVLRRAQHEEDAEATVLPFLLILSSSKDEDAPISEGRPVSAPKPSRT